MGEVHYGSRGILLIFIKNEKMKERGREGGREREEESARAGGREPLSRDGTGRKACLTVSILSRPTNAYSSIGAVQRVQATAGFLPEPLFGCGKMSLALFLSILSNR